MSKETNESKFFGYQLGISIASYLSEQQRPINLKEARGVLDDIANGNLTLTDPENTGRGFDAKTVEALRGTSFLAIDANRQHAQDVQAGNDSIMDEVNKED